MPKISVLVIHNRYQQSGGEDAVVRAEVEQLRARGHCVIEYMRDNTEISGYGRARTAALALRAIWSSDTYATLRDLIRRERPDIAHIHNFFPLVSPAAHYACKASGIPVVQTLHNYRLVCPAATLFSGRERCRQCGRGFRRGIWRGCYRRSRVQTAALAAMLAAHRISGTWQHCVDAFLVPSQFCRDYFVTAGLPASKVHVYANSLAHDPGPRNTAGDYALFVGRLSPEKGVLELVRAWQQIPDVPLLLAGDGPLRGQLEQAAKSCHRVELLGQLSPAQTIARMKEARFVIFPSRWYEPFGMGLLEAAACGVPAIASRIGAIAELVADGETGLLFDPDNFDELIEKVRWAGSHSAEMDQMGRAARQRYLQQFTPEKSYDAWMNVCRILLG